jgi:CRP-like cAMP-binding protein
LHSPNSPFKTNRLLAALPVEDYQRLAGSLEAISLQVKDRLYEPNQPIEYVYFPLSGMASILSVMGGGRLIEAAIVGNEGMVGLSIFLGADTSTSLGFYQITGEALRLRADLFRAEINQNGALMRIMQRYTHAHIAMLTQNTGCNSQHNIHQRCARWLLHTHDCVEGNEIGLTQEFLSQMLGVRRAGVSLVMQTLHQRGFIHYSRGKITIVDRPGLERVACECYGIITAEYGRMLDN